MAKQIIHKHYQRILAQWPTDLLRPTVSFQKSLQQRTDSRYNLSPENIKNEGAQPIVPFDEKKELEQVNVLYSFLEDRYMKKYPLPEKVLKPASRPSHYVDLLKELQAAPERSWWRARLNRWKGIVRSH